MPYVLVPVPEEHVPEVMRHVVRLLGQQDDDALEEWDEDAVHRFFAECGEDGRSLLSLLASPEHAGRGMSPRQVGRELELRGQHLAGIVGPLNKRARRAFNRLPLVMSERVGGEDGRAERRLLLDEEHAEWIRRAEAVHDGRGE